MTEEKELCKNVLQTKSSRSGEEIKEVLQSKPLMVYPGSLRSALTEQHNAAPASQPESLTLPLACTGGILPLHPRMSSMIIYLAPDQGFLKCTQSALLSCSGVH